MGRPRNTIPKYTRHKASGQARVRIYGKDIYLGKWNSKESRVEYNRICAELEAGSPATSTTTSGTSSGTVNEVVAAFLVHAGKHYRDEDGEATSEMKWIASSVAKLVELYGHTPAASFGPLSLKAIREQWVKAKLCRKSVNGRVNRIRRLFKWAASEELVPVTVYQALATVAGLKVGRSDAEDRPPVAPVPNLNAVSASTHLRPSLRAMLLVQRLTGMRPGEITKMKVGEIDRSHSPWIYTPRHHKTTYRGGVRRILIGPQAVELLAPFLEGRDPTEYVFTPSKVQEERYNAIRAQRERGIGSDAKRSRAIPPAKRKVKPVPAFTCPAYAAAVRRACHAAGVPAFSPNRLRHSFATECREVFGLEAAQVLLGHTKADVTQVYAEKNLALAKRVAMAIG